MKKMISVFTAVLLGAFLLTGCGEKEDREIIVPVLTEAPATEPVRETEPLILETQVFPEETTEPVPEPETTAAAEEPAETEPVKTVGRVIRVETLNVREGPSVNTRVVGKLHKSDEVTIKEGIVLDSVQWAHVDEGWVCLDYLEVNGPVPAPRGREPGGMPGVIYHTDTLNVRGEPNGSSSKVGQLNRNDVVVIYETDHGWGRMDQGWISMEYVQLQKDNEKLSVTGGDWVPEHTPESDLHDFTAPSEGEYMENPVKDYWEH